jgi:hypothetical protein
MPVVSGLLVAGGGAAQRFRGAFEVARRRLGHQALGLDPRPLHGLQTEGVGARGDAPAAGLHADLQGAGEPGGDQEGLRPVAVGRPVHGEENRAVRAAKLQGDVDPPLLDGHQQVGPRLRRHGIRLGLAAGHRPLDPGAAQGQLPRDRERRADRAERQGEAGDAKFPGAHSV